MRAIPILAMTTLLMATPCVAAPKEQPKKQAGPTVRFFEFYDNLLGDLSIEGILKETRQGATVTAATLDVCFPAAPNTSRKDRFVVTLAPQGGKLVGSGQTQDSKEPVQVELTRKQAGGQFSFEGKIKRGSIEHTASASDMSEVTEDNVSVGRTPDETISEAPAMFKDVLPGSIGVRVKREALGDLLKTLKTEAAIVEVGTLLTDCNVLRAGNLLVQFAAPPARVPTLMTKLRALPGVVRAGWVPGTYNIDNAVLVPAAPWSQGSDVARDKLAAAVSSSFAKALNATAQSSTWNDQTGELTLNLKRPNQSLLGLGLIDDIKIILLAGPDKPGSTDKLMLWLGYANTETTDAGPSPRLALSQVSEGEGSSALDSVDTLALAAALAKDLGGRTWNSEAEKWN